MTVWIKEWLSLLLSCFHLCLLSLWGEQLEFPSINQNPILRKAITELLTSQNAKRSVKIKNKIKKQDKHLLNVIDVQELISSLLVGENGRETTA